MKAKTIGSIIFICVVLFSCGSLVEAVKHPSPANASGSTQTETPSTQNQPAQNTQNKAESTDDAIWDIAALDTARNVNYLTTLEKDVVLEMNKVRANPKKYAELYIQPLLQYFNGKRYSVPGQTTWLTEEGAAAVNECVAVLSKAASAGVLKPEKGLSLAAKDHVTDMGKTGHTEHNGSDKSTPETRIRRYGTFSGSWTWGENLSWGETTARNVVCSLLIDDGVPDRAHRANIMNRAFTQTGVAYGAHPQYDFSCAITYTNGYRSN